jgi:iron complex transport system ATP-binding protein
MIPLIQLQDVSLIRSKKKILNNLSWTVRPGEHWFMLGQNGSGKTSLLEIVLGYKWASEGEVRVLGETYGKTYLPELRKKIGYVAPWIDERIKPEETSEEVVAGGLDATVEFLREFSSAIQKQVRAQLKQMGIENFAEAPFRRLSSGEKLKVLIARALISKPKILILDEPFSALDAGSRISINRKIESLIQKPAAPGVILVTHHFDDISPFYSHGLILKEGRILALGKKTQVLKPESLKRAFEVPITLFKRQNRYFLQ